MARYLTQHSLACLTRQGAEALAQRMLGGGTLKAELVLVNMQEGKMFGEFRAGSRDELEGCGEKPHQHGTRAGAPGLEK